MDVGVNGDGWGRLVMGGDDDNRAQMGGWWVMGAGSRWWRLKGGMGIKVVAVCFLMSSEVSFFLLVWFCGLFLYAPNALFHFLFVFSFLRVLWLYCRVLVCCHLPTCLIGVHFESSWNLSLVALQR